MNDFRIFLLEILAFSRKSSRSPESILSSVSITIIVFGLTTLILLITPIFMTKELSLLLIYGIVIFEVLLGLRVGFLRIGQNPNEQFLPVASRFWKRSFPYLFPALLIPLPLSIALTSFLATSATNWWIVLITAITSYMMFFFLGVAWSMIIRLVSRRSFPRIIILLLSVGILFSVISPNDFVFRTLLLSQNYSDYTQLFVIIAQLSTAAFLIISTDLALKNIPLTTSSFGRYWPIFLAGNSPGHGQGSSSFFTTNKMLVRDSALHRRISGLILSLLLFLLTIYVILFVGGSQLNLSAVLVSILLFTAVSALLISRLSAQSAYNKIENMQHLPINKNKILAGSWLAGLAWQIGVAVVFFGLINAWIKIESEILILIILAASTQHILFFGWSKKLNSANHYNLSLFAVFSLAALVGIFPILLLPLTGIVQTGIVQLIWLGFVSILLHITTQREGVRYA